MDVRGPVYETWWPSIHSRVIQALRGTYYFQTGLAFKNDAMDVSECPEVLKTEGRSEQA